MASGSTSVINALEDLRPMRIRPASMNDLPGLLMIEDLCFGNERFDAEMIAGIMSDEGSETYIAEDDGAVIGSAMVHHDNALGRSRIISIAIVPSHRGRGLGRRLLDHLERRARDRRSTVMELEVRVINVPAIDLYLSTGYEIQGTIPNYFGRGEDALYMEKNL